jgi:hypothetical protein
MQLPTASSDQACCDSNADSYVKSLGNGFLSLAPPDRPRKTGTLLQSGSHSRTQLEARAGLNQGTQLKTRTQLNRPPRERRGAGRACCAGWTAADAGLKRA